MQNLRGMQNKSYYMPKIKWNRVSTLDEAKAGDENTIYFTKDTHDIVIKGDLYCKDTDIDFNSGAMDDKDLWCWYNAGIKIEKAEWNTIGDYCILSLTNIPTKEGWGVIYYSLPFPYTTSTHGLAKATNYSGTQDVYWSLSEDVGTKVLRISPTNSSSLIGATFSITLIYKYK